MEDTAITLKEAIVQVDAWRASMDKGCLLHGKDKDRTNYTWYVSKWAAYNDVALLLAKIAVKESE